MEGIFRGRYSIFLNGQCMRYYLFVLPDLESGRTDPHDIPICPSCQIYNLAAASMSILNAETPAGLQIRQDGIDR